MEWMKLGRKDKLGKKKEKEYKFFSLFSLYVLPPTKKREEKARIWGAN